MLNCPLRYCNHFRRFNAVIANNGLETTFLGNSRKYNKDKGDCCKDISQTEGKRIEEWPKCDPPPPAWTANCPRDPQPPNYDPYRIKVPDVVVPPLPPSNAKWMGVVLTTNQPGGRDQTYQEPGFTQESEQSPQSSEEQAEKEEEIGSGGFFGYLRSLFGKDRGKTGKGEGEVSMIGQRLWINNCR
ncbi:unnamed protein product [Euphydryas editha]|uniref:Uncharacterized protein n=1 Tax=Euphydryas editha TaxID=104508 RepID=A0AAU9TN20_EUPED|nr:unnamed protein product [Euphydryas editha]